MNKENHSESKISVRERRLLVIACSAVLILIVITAALWPNSQEKPQVIPLSEVAAEIAGGRVTRIVDSLNGRLTITAADGKTVIAQRDPNASLLEQLHLLGLTESQLTGVQFEMAQTSVSPAASPLGLLLIAGLIGSVVFFTYRYNTADRSRSKTFQAADVPDIRFKDIAGLDDHLQELRDVVSFLKDGERFADMGARMPRGVLMVGDPGTGKTLIAKAVAGEAGVPFFATSGSEFTEVFVGVGASRILSLFQKARKKAPCIVFIDEIDAVCRARRRSESGAEMEQDQTLNQLLVEMDGFSPSDGIIVLAATNRVDVLDPALTRPGRFDRNIYINRPDLKGREEILKIHAQGKKLSPEVDLLAVARATPGLVGADLANIVNEAAINAVRCGHSCIEMSDFEEAVEKQIAGGVQRKSHVMSLDEKRIVAYHEAGHAVVIHHTELSDPVVKISIIPRGQAGGYTLAVPDHDQMLISRCKMLAKITGLMGGRAAEEIFLQDITSGASNDLEVATRLAEDMVTRLGMDARTGLRVFQASGERSLLAFQGSQKTCENIDQAVHEILESCYEEARRILTTHRDQVEQIAQELLETETMDRERFLQIMGQPLAA